MAEKIVIGLFETAGIAGDACNRLRYVGVPDRDISMVVMRETTERPAHMDAEIEGLSVDPLLLGNVRESYAPYIHNGDTAVFVRAETEADVRVAIDTLKQYAPAKVSVATRGEIERAAAMSDAQLAAAEIDIIVY